MGFSYRAEATPIDTVGEKTWEQKQVEMRAKTEHDKSLFGDKPPWRAYIYWMRRGDVNASIEARGKSPSAAVEKLYVEWSRMKSEGWEQDR